MKQRLYQQGIAFLLVALIICISYPVNASGEDDDLEVVRLQLRWGHQFQFAGYYAADWQGLCMI